ncbi:MAG: hypothetical protein M1816_004408 [Peltula sp. TS41687]|nr:MAG: hypothetical protein M1816_004408 [Peltula sp. TS41687]
MEDFGSAVPPALSSFPQTPEQFDQDDRISFSKLDQKWILEADDGTEFEWDQALKRWIPSMDEALLQKQGEVYAMAGVDENQPTQAQRKRKGAADTNYTNSTQKEENGKIRSKKAKPNREAPARKNSAIYVTNLPPDATFEEVNSVFSKCGVIAEGIDEGKPRIKLYADEEGRFKGDALIVYFRAESVPLAVQMLDDTNFRFGEDGVSGKMKVQAADYSYKKQREAPAETSAQEKKKIIKKSQKLNSKLADWDDDDPSAIPDTSKWDKVVILKHMFTLKELEEDPASILDIKEDIRDECAKLGEVTNVVLFDREEDGVASVRYANAEAAAACVRMMDGRFFSGTRVEAYIANGSEKFKKSKEKKVGLFDDDDQEGDTENKRLDQFGSWLEEAR